MWKYERKRSYVIDCIAHIIIPEFIPITSESVGKSLLSSTSTTTPKKPIIKELKRMNSVLQNFQTQLKKYASKLFKLCLHPNHFSTCLFGKAIIHQFHDLPTLTTICSFEREFQNSHIWNYWYILCTFKTTFRIRMPPGPSSSALLCPISNAVLLPISLLETHSQILLSHGFYIHVTLLGPIILSLTSVYFSIKLETQSHWLQQSYFCNVKEV